MVGKKATDGQAALLHKNYGWARRPVRGAIIFRPERKTLGVCGIIKKL